MPYDYEKNKDVLFDSTGRVLTVGLFRDLAYNSNPGALFSIADWHAEYMAVCDPTEYSTAISLIGSWPHWLALRANRRLAELFDTWRMEVEIKIRSQNVINMMMHAERKSGTNAAKWLAEGKFTDRDGRTKKGKKENAVSNSGVSEQVRKDAERLGLKVVNGGA